jgi:L-lactate dehydrogenase complex protein LldG
MDRAAFLARFHRAAGTASPHPGQLADPHAEVGDWDRFATVLTTVGGAMLQAPAGWRAAVQGAIDLDAGPVVAAPAAQVLLACCTGWVPSPPAADPHASEPVGLAILVGEQAVAENAAVLLSADVLPGRSLAFLAQRILLLVPCNRLIGGFLTAQARAARLQRERRWPHCTWMSGPSKTADIEQCLVIGAHGARSLTVAVIDPA